MDWLLLGCCWLLVCCTSVCGKYRTWQESDNRPDECHEGTAYSSVITSSSKECASQCLHTYPTCTAVNYRDSDGNCQMFNYSAEALIPCAGKTYMQIRPPIGKDSNLDSGSCVDGWTRRGSFCYQYQEEAMNFNDAYEHCLTLSANLVSIHDYYENQFVAGLAPYDVEVLTGATKQSGDRMVLRLVWSDASPSVYTFWSETEPDKEPAPSYCIRILRQERNSWADASCFEKAPFICQKPSV